MVVRTLACSAREHRCRAQDDVLVIPRIVTHFFVAFLCCLCFLLLLLLLLLFVQHILLSHFCELKNRHIGGVFAFF